MRSRTTLVIVAAVKPERLASSTRLMVPAVRIRSSTRAPVTGREG